MGYSTKVTINAIDVTEHCINYAVEDTVTDITPAIMIFKTNVETSIDLSIEQEVIITRGTTTSTDNTIFKGNISNVTKVSGVNYRIEAQDKLWLLKRKVKTTTYDKNIDSQVGIISAIAQDIIETHGGLTADVENTGTVITLDKYVMRGISLLDSLLELAEIVDYWVYYDPDTDKVIFKSKGFTTFSTVLQVGVNIVEVPEWGYNYQKIANDVTLIGDLQELEDTVTDTGDGVTTDYTLTFKPESVKVFVDSVLKTGGVTNQTGTFDYTVDKENKTITFSTAPGVLSIEIRYSYLVPIKVRSKNYTSIGKYGTYAISKKIDSIQTTNDAEKKVTEITNKFSEPSIKSKIKIYDVYGIQAGMKVSVIDNANNETRDVFVRKITYNYPIPIDDIKVDNNPIYEDYILFNEMRKRVERLERKNESDGTLINQLIPLDRTFKPTRRYSKLEKEEITDTTSLIWNHPSNQGKWNNGTTVLTKWGGTAFGSATTQKLIQSNMTYKERIYDTTFHDSVNSTATFTTGTNTISFTSGQIWYSEAIDIGTTLTAVRVDLGTITGTLKIEISSDNKSTWQEVTEATLTGVITSDGTGTYIRITENAAGVATITNSTESTGKISDSAIEVQLIE